MNLEKALALGGRIVAERKAKGGQKTTYVLHYTNDPTTTVGTMEGHNMAELGKEFLRTNTLYSYALIVKKGAEEKFLRVYNKNEGKKFISLVAKRKAVVAN